MLAARLIQRVARAARATPSRRSTPSTWRCSSCSVAPPTVSAAVTAVPTVQDAETKEKSRKLAGLFWKLSKGKLTVWVSISAMPGYLLAAPAALDPFVFTSLACGTFLTSASAQTMNQLIEVDKDAKMHRTAMRPLPTGQLSRNEGLGFAAATGAGGLALLSAGATPATAAVAGATMAIYAAMYTPMKVMSPYNTHVGAVSGALPTVMGFTAALGTGLVASPWAAHAAWLFGMQVLWQMPHFYALAWIHKADYLRGGYTMFPLHDETGLATAKMSKPYLVALCAMPVAASAAGLASWMLPVGCLLPSALWWRTLKNFEAKPSVPTCRKFFLGSLSYLLATLALFTAYARTDAQEATETESAVHAEPLWRTRISTFFGELCPHERVRGELFGMLGNSCPFGPNDTPKAA